MNAPQPSLIESPVIIIPSEISGQKTALFKKTNFGNGWLPIRGWALMLIIWVTLTESIRAQISTDDQVNYVKTIWNITSVSDDTIKATLDFTPSSSSYNGIPYKNWISFLLVAPDIYAAIENDDYRTAARLAGNFGASVAFNSALADVGLDSVFSIASLAEFPIEIGLNDFANAVKNASFQHQVEFYFAVRDANGDQTLSAVLQLHPGDLIDASGSIAPQGLLLVDDSGWLSTGGSYLYGDPQACTPAQFYTQADNLYTGRQSGSQLAGISTDLGNLFRSAVLPTGPVINQHPQGGTYVQGGSFQLSVGATGTQPLAYQWMLNGSSIAGATESTYTVSGDQGGVFTVSVTDANGLGVISEAATVTMLPTTTSVAFTTPASGATLSGTVRVQAAASASTRIAYYVDGVLRSTTTIAPFLWTWNTAGDDDGAHTIIAKAYIGNSLAGTSPGLPVMINNGGANMCGDPNEPNNSSVTATLMALDTSNTNGIICSPTDVDWFQVNVTNAGLLQIKLQVPAGEDYDLELYGPNATWVAGSYNGAGIAESVQYNAMVPGIYYFRVYGYPLGAGDFHPSAKYSVVVMSERVAASAGYALFSRTTDTIAINGHTVANSEFTIEAEVMIPSAFATSSMGRIFDEQYSGQCDKELLIGPSGVLGGAWAGAPNGVDDPGIHATNALSLDGWHHVAFVRDTDEQRLYLDGGIIGTRILSGTPYDEPISNSSASQMAIGAFLYTFGEGLTQSFLGKIQWVRISGIARYSGTAFSPPAAVPTTDAQTLAFFDFSAVDPGSTTVPDLSRQGFVGTVAEGFSGATAPAFVIVPNFSGLQVIDNAFIANLTGVAPGQTVVLQTSTNLADWASIQTNSANGPTLSFTNAVDPANRTRFFRAFVQ